MSSPILLIIGVAALGLALRTWQSVLLQKLGTLCILAASFLIGYFASGSIWLGLFCATSWLLLPWLELITHVRKLRLPHEKSLRPRSAPSSEVFPALDDLSGELEDEKFEHLSDAGWEWQEQEQFFRLFYRDSDRAQASICLIEQEQMMFYYLSVSSRGKNGKIWTTWNYPFSYSLKLPPQMFVNRLRSDQAFLQLLESHRDFLRHHEIAVDDLAELNEESATAEIQNDLRQQIAHNLASGLLEPVDAEHVRYSWRGLLFIWLQFLRDFVKFS
jgi:hypothetical protein